MDRDERIEALRARNRRRAAHCPRCESASVHELTAADIARRDDTLVGLRYRTCGACGHTWTVRGPRRT